MADLEEILQLVTDFLRKKSFVGVAQILEEKIVEAKETLGRGYLEGSSPSSRLEVLVRKGLASEMGLLEKHTPNDIGSPDEKTTLNDHSNTESELDMVSFSPRKKFFEHMGSPKSVAQNRKEPEVGKAIPTNPGGTTKQSVGISIPKSAAAGAKWSPQSVSLEGESSFRASSRHSRESHHSLMDLPSPRSKLPISASLPILKTGPRKKPTNPPKPTLLGEPKESVIGQKPILKLPPRDPVPIIENKLLEIDYVSSDEEDSTLPTNKQTDSATDIFHMDLNETPPKVKKISVGEAPEFENPCQEKLEFFNLKVIYKPNHTGFEESRDFPIKQNDIIAGRYEITQYLGSAAFSRAIQCRDRLTDRDVCIKIIKNTKDFFDQCLDEIKLLKYIKRMGDPDSNYVLQMYDFFYFKEHLFIVCELLGDNLYEFYKLHKSLGTPYFTLPRLQAVAKQCLIAVKYIHSLDLIHCDLKPENILMHDYVKCQIKVIDFGSSCFIGDELSTYVQSRSYRAPEVILGLPYGQSIDLWSIGCILAELFTGNVLFQNTSVATLLGRIMSIMGPFQQKLLVKGKFTNKYFTPDGILFEKTKEGMTQVLFPQTNLKSQFAVQDEGFISFLECLLKVNPKDRYTASQALEHPWLAFNYSDKPTSW